MINETYETLVDIAISMKQTNQKTLKAHTYLEWVSSFTPVHSFIPALALVINELCEKNKIAREELYERFDSFMDREPVDLLRGDLGE